MFSTNTLIYCIAIHLTIQLTTFNMDGLVNYINFSIKINAINHSFKNRVQF